MRATTGTLMAVTLPEALFKPPEPAVQDSFMNGAVTVGAVICSLLGTGGRAIFGASCDES
jgi:hypothetical protein